MFNPIFFSLSTFGPIAYLYSFYREIFLTVFVDSSVQMAQVVPFCFIEMLSPSFCNGCICFADVNFTIYSVGYFVD
jgi:hypothetical protein